VTVPVLKGIAPVVILTGVGISVMNFNGGFLLAAFYLGCVLGLAAIYRHGTNTGHHLIRPQYNLLGILAGIGLFITACVSTVEALLKHG
jgi:hypothetical protein